MNMAIYLESDPLDLLAHAPNLVGELAALVTRDGSGDNSTADTASTSERDLGRNVDVGDYRGR